MFEDLNKAFDAIKKWIPVIAVCLIWLSVVAFINVIRKK